MRLRPVSTLASVLVLGLIGHLACFADYGADLSATSVVDADAEETSVVLNLDGGAPEASVCVPPKCGGRDGTCGAVEGCGLTFLCGECSVPATCNEGTCRCLGKTCQALRATCGAVDDGCGNVLECGRCDGGACQATDGGGLDCK